MIDSLIVFLKELKKVTFESVLGFSYIHGLLLITVGGFLLHNRSIAFSNSNIGIFGFLLFVGVLVGIGLLVHKGLKNKYSSILPIIYVILLPLVIGGFFVFDTGFFEHVIAEITDDDFSRSAIGTLQIVLGVLFMIHPIIVSVQAIKNKTLKIVEHTIWNKIFLYYQILFLSLVSGLLVYLMSDSGFHILSVLPLIVLLPILCISIFQHTKRGVSVSYFKWILGGGIIGIICLLGVPSLLSYYYENNLKKVERNIKDMGVNKETLEGIKKKKLAKGYLRRFNSNQYADTTLFQKIFDTTPERYFGDKLSKKRQDGNRRSNATNATNVGKKANVLLKLGEITNEISFSGPELPILESTYSFHLTNTTISNQEVIIYFEAPSSYSVVSDLVLGLDGEMQGVIAPRGAAKKVYADALRTNKDPALIEKLGLNTYSLRVFPIPSKNNNTLKGRQLVTFKILTPILDTQEEILYTPKFNFINLKYGTDSSFISKVYLNEELIIEDVKKSKDIERYLLENNSVKKSDIGITSTKNIFDYCLPKELVSTIGGFPRVKSLANMVSKKKELKKTSLFFDNSMSSKRNNVSTYYEHIYENIKNDEGKLRDVDSYSFNHIVEKVSDIDDIGFRGYSDTDSVLAFIEKNGLENQRIIIVTDDDSYNYSTTEKKSRNLELLLNNQIVIYKIGNDIRRFKSDMNNLISSSRGDIYEIRNTEDVQIAIGKTFNPIYLTFEVREECSTHQKKRALSQIHKIMGGYLGGLLPGLIDKEEDRNNIATIQTEIAKEYEIVNQFNAYIAMENERQKKDLDRYSNLGDKYDSEYDNLESQKSLGSNRAGGTGGGGGPFLRGGGNFMIDNEFGDTAPSNSVGGTSGGGSGGGFLRGVNQLSDPTADMGVSENLELIGAGAGQADRSFRDLGFVSRGGENTAGSSDGGYLRMRDFKEPKIGDRIMEKIEDYGGRTIILILILLQVIYTFRIFIERISGKKINDPYYTKPTSQESTSDKNE